MLERTNLFFDVRIDRLIIPIGTLGSSWRRWNVTFVRKRIKDFSLWLPAESGVPNQCFWLRYFVLEYKKSLCFVIYFSCFYYVVVHSNWEFLNKNLRPDVILVLLTTLWRCFRGLKTGHFEPSRGNIKNICQKSNIQSVWQIFFLKFQLCTGRIYQFI